MTRFCRYELRTTDVAAARAFYAAVLGDDAEIVPLAPEAAARGAPAHWLGHLGVDDVERAASALVERGAVRLDPTRSTADGGGVAIIRDPGGAVVALATRPPSVPRADVVWHLLHAAGLDRAAASYCEEFGWQRGRSVDLGPLGIHREFAWVPGGPDVGAMTDIAGRRGVHPHWLFHFRIAALEPALAVVRAAGGVVIGPTALPGGGRIAVCDDPQGAAFALCEGPIGSAARHAATS